MRSGLERATTELSADLHGHRAACANLQRELELARLALSRERVEQARVAADLAADLDGHRATCANLQRELAIVRVAHARDRAEHERVAQDLLAEIAAYRSAKAELEADLAGHRHTVADLLAAVNAVSPGRA